MTLVTEPRIRHSARHSEGGSDALGPEDIGAMTAYRVRIINETKNQGDFAAGIFYTPTDLDKGFILLHVSATATNAAGVTDLRSTFAIYNHGGGVLTSILSPAIGGGNARTLHMDWGANTGNSPSWDAVEAADSLWNFHNGAPSDNNERIAKVGFTFQPTGNAGSTLTVRLVLLEV